MEYEYLAQTDKVVAFKCPVCEEISKSSYLKNGRVICLSNENVCNCGFHSKFISKDKDDSVVAKAKGIKDLAIILDVVIAIAVIPIWMIIWNYSLEHNWDAWVAVLLIFTVPVLATVAIVSINKETDKKINAAINNGKEYLIQEFNLEDKERVDDNTRRFNEAKNKYVLLKAEANIPDNCKIVSVNKIFADPCISRGQYYLSKDNSSIKLLPVILSDQSNVNEYVSLVDNAKVVSFQIDIIEYFATRGEIYRETKITGGGGGGSSIKGAVVGGLIAGGAGAVIGSRKKGDPINSEILTHDTREAFMNVFDKEGNRKSIFFLFSDFQTLKDVIPEKEFGIVSAIKSDQVISKVKKDEKTKSITTQIRELAQLKDEGILSEEEFQNKKLELLKKI